MEESKVTDVPGVAEKPSLPFDVADIHNIETAAWWGRFLAIVQFVMLGLGTLGVLLALLAVAGVGAAVPGLGMMGAASVVSLSVCLVAILVAFVPAFYLYRSSVRALAAVKGGSGTAMSEAIFNLRRLAVFQGIMVIAVIVVYLFMIPMAIFS
ncbi:MAG: hypothetical protein LBV18_01765 [Alistipes sp.]|jgi:hypothetical protein|nr:hypothetical protein [Alistipes sp.]